ncbi:RTA1 like protein-domain-containing protein [Gautieria morchelliformis]|nr:RTA1 like protein-domain-containing protein [Gautieria morchelliformis]
MTTNSSSSDTLVVTPTTLYGYVPTLWICFTFVILFSITTIVHIVEALLFKPRLLWLLYTTAMCGVGEIVGWSGRLWNSENPENSNAYLMQIVTTIIAPVFLTAALYNILGRVIAIIGPEYSRLSPKTYLKVFVTADVVALVVQAAGGALATSNNTSTSNLGSHIMLAGIFFQMAGILGYTLLAAEFLFRFYLHRPFAGAIQASPPDSPLNDKSWTQGTENGGAVLPPRISLMVLALVLSTILVFIRTIYRTIELSGGWNGHIIRTEAFFNTLDATPIFLAMFILNFLSPAFLLRTEAPGY